MTNSGLQIIFHTFYLFPWKTSYINIAIFVYGFFQLAFSYVFHHTSLRHLGCKCFGSFCLLIIFFWRCAFSLLPPFFITFITWFIFFLVLSIIQLGSFFLVILRFRWLLPCFVCNRDNRNNRVSNWGVILCQWIFDC